MSSVLGATGPVESTLVRPALDVKISFSISGITHSLFKPHMDLIRTPPHHVGLWPQDRGQREHLSQILRSYWIELRDRNGGAFAVCVCVCVCVFNDMYKNIKRTKDMFLMRPHSRRSLLGEQQLRLQSYEHRQEDVSLRCRSDANSSCLA